MEARRSPRFVPSSLFELGPLANSFSVFNAVSGSPEASYMQLLEKPRLLTGRLVKRFAVKFASDKDLEDFEGSPCSKYFKNKTREKKSLLPGFTEYTFKNKKSVNKILEEVARFYPIEVRFGQQREEKSKNETKRVNKSEEAEESDCTDDDDEEEEDSEEEYTAEIKQTKETKQKKEVKPKSETKQIKKEFLEEAKQKNEREHNEEAVEPEPTKKFKNQENKYINVEVYQELLKVQGDLDLVIQRNPELGEKILADPDSFDRLEKRVQNKIKQQIFQEWLMGIKFKETNVKEIKESLKDKSLEHINLRRELFLEREDELKMFEEGKAIPRIVKKEA